MAALTRTGRSRLGFVTSRPDLGDAPAQVCLSEEAAIAAVSRGADVVLVLDPRAAASSGALPVEDGELYGSERGSCRGRRGRLALFLGEVANPADLVAARAMADELFGRPLPSQRQSDRR